MERVETKTKTSGNIVKHVVISCKRDLKSRVWNMHVAVLGEFEYCFRLTLLVNRLLLCSLFERLLYYAKVLLVGTLTLIKICKRHSVYGLHWIDTQICKSNVVVTYTDCPMQPFALYVFFHNLTYNMSLDDSQVCHLYCKYSLV